jgi:hypothetical protein
LYMICILTKNLQFTIVRMVKIKVMKAVQRSTLASDRNHRKQIKMVPRKLRPLLTVSTKGFSFEVPLEWRRHEKRTG